MSLLAALLLPNNSAVAQPAPTLDASSSDSPIVLPAVTGDIGIGTFTASWTDSSRTITTRQSGRSRSVAIHFWYPAQVAPAAALAPYAPGVDPLANDYGKLVARVRGHASWEAPFAKGHARAPIVVLSTGRAMAAYDYSSLAEDLASHGYVVVGVNSPYLSRFWTPEGDFVEPMPAPPLKVLQHFDDADVFFEPMIRDVAADLRFVVDKMEQIDRSDPILKGHLDRRRLAMIGHSNGALAASRACAEDKRCRAFLGIEGTQSREIRKHGVRKPYGLLISEQSLGYDAENVYRELGGRSGSPFTAIVVKGAGHNTFTDLPLTRPAQFTYPIGASRGLDITRLAVRGFLDEKLLGRRKALTTALAGFPDVEVQTEFSTPAGASDLSSSGK